MKKIYSTPEVAIVNVELQDMIANSPVEAGFTMGDDTPVLDSDISSGNMGRSGSLWDEED